MDLTAAYIAGAKACGLKNGDRVRITRKAESYEQGWDNAWINGEMDDYIGRVFKIYDKNITSKKGISLSETCCAWPWFVLEKVEDEKTAIEEKVREIDFGCNTEKVIKILEWFKETYIDHGRS